MKTKILIASFTIVGFLSLLSCIDQQQKDERLARRYCGSCHVFPDPILLDKTTWYKSVLPQMAFRMGLDYSLLSTISNDDQAEVISTLPGKAMVSQSDWEAIQDYYLKNAPDTLFAPSVDIKTEIKQFDGEVYKLPGFPMTTFVQPDTINNKIYVGSRLKKLYRLNHRLDVEDSFMLKSPPSDLHFSKQGDLTLLLMGIMDPNDQALGEISTLNQNNRSWSTIIDSLKRPVNFEISDLDNDGLDDIVVCAFGNYSGALLAYKNLGDGKYQKYVLQNLPGARKIIIRDFDNNGTPDILALLSQGDEKIILLLNQGNFNFRLNTLLSFPPVYGSSFFDVADFNNDGKPDILYTNGDNADYSMILKPYHGVRIFLNNGKNEFSESWFYNMHGASQALARDFDGDGDLDIAAISFFPDFKNHPEHGFIYFENTGTDFIPQVTPLAAAGRWLTLEAADIDHDGDEDLMLGALDFNSGVPEKLWKTWSNDQVSILLLRNNYSKNQTP